MSNKVLAQVTQKNAANQDVGEREKLFSNASMPYAIQYTRMQSDTLDQQVSYTSGNIFNALHRAAQAETRRKHVFQAYTQACGSPAIGHSRKYLGNGILARTAGEWPLQTARPGDFLKCGLYIHLAARVWIKQ